MTLAIATLALLAGAPETAAPSAPLPLPASLAVPAPDWKGAAAALAVIGALGAATLLLKRRQRMTSRHIQVVETTSLGPKHSLSLVVVGGRALLVACSEGSVSLLDNQPAPKALTETLTEPATEPRILEATPEVARAQQAIRKFDTHLVEAEETQNLRRRLAQEGVGA